MSKEVKIISIMVSLILLTVLLGVALINEPYLLPEQLDDFRFFIISNYYMQQYFFWTAIALSIAIIILLLIILFYPKSKRTFVLKHKDGKLILDKKAIEDFVLSNLSEKEFMHYPKVKVYSTNNKINIHVKGDLKRTSSLIGKTNSLIQEIKEKVEQVIGEDQNIKIGVTYNGYQKKVSFNNNKHIRVE